MGHLRGRAGNGHPRYLEAQVRRCGHIELFLRMAKPRHIARPANDLCCACSKAVGCRQVKRVAVQWVAG